MNLEELKYLWQQAEATPKLDARQVEGMLRGSSRSLLRRINTTILIETALVALIGLAWVYDLSQRATPWWEIASLVAYVLGSIYFYYRKYRNLNELPARAPNLYAGLKHLVSTLDRYVTLYRVIGWGVLPLTWIGGMFYGMFVELRSEDRNLSDVPGENWIAFILTALVGAAVVIWIAHRYIYWAYGRHLDNLRAQLAEFQEELDER